MTTKRRGRDRISRRRFLKAAGTALAAGAAGTIPVLSCSPSKEKAAGAKTLRILQWSHFVPGYDAWFDGVYTKEWGGTLLNVVLGALYVLAGFVLWANPLAGAVSLTLLLAVMLVASGIVRLWLAYQHWQAMGGLFTFSGIIAILAGLVIFAGWPSSSLWVLGLCLAIDVLFQGFAWLMFGFALRPRA